MIFKLDRGELDILAHGQMREQVKLLEHHPHAAANQVDIGLLEVMFCPSKMISPLVGSSNRFRQRRKVDLPEPEGPMITHLLTFLNMLINTF